MTTFRISDQTLRVGAVVVGALALVAALGLFALEMPSWFLWTTLATGAIALTAGCWYAATPAQRWLAFTTAAVGLACGVAPAWASWTAPREGWPLFASVVSYLAILASLVFGALAGWREYEESSGSVPVTKA